MALGGLLWGAGACCSGAVRLQPRGAEWRVLSGRKRCSKSHVAFEVGRDKNSQPIWRRELPMHGEEALLRMSDSWEAVKIERILSLARW